MRDYMSIDFFSSSKNNSDNSENKNSPTVPIPMSTETAAIMCVAEITKEAIHCFTEYAKCVEHEKTERARIKATLKAIEYQIDAQKEIYLTQLEKSYAERLELYSRAFKAQEKALQENDIEMLKLCYNFILSVYNQRDSNNLELSDFRL